MACIGLLAWIPMVNPMTLPPGARLWLFLPLAACVAVVYRATRANRAQDMPYLTVKTFINLVLGMVAIAVGAYVLHEAVLYFSD